MQNTNYAPEIASANEFIISHSYDTELRTFIKEMMNKNCSHSEKWSEIYDWMAERYPEATGSLITGITYWVER